MRLPVRVARAARLVACLAACAAGVAVGNAAAGEVEDPSCGVMVVPRPAGRLTLRLPHAFLRPGRDSVWTRSGALAAGTDYLIDRLRGELRLLVDPPLADTLWVRACWLLEPPPLERQLAAWHPAAPAPAVPESASTQPPGRAPRPAVARDPSAAPSGAALTVTGNKTIAVDFGTSQDAALRQSLDLAVSGQLAPEVTLTGVLSDRNTPLSAEGGTQELQALDRVLIELRGPRASASLGDIGVAFREGEFARVERRVQGVRADWAGSNLAGAGAAASETGEYHRLQFFGADGRQGPYLLTDRSGNPGISVVAGSEIVTLDGARLARGESADYSIDYDRGQITFTNRRPISSASRITVDYQFTLRRYRRNFAAFEGRFAARALRGFTRVLTEGDDRGRPLDVALDAGDQAALGAAGDSSTAALGAGVTPGGGDYDTVRTSGAIHFAFAGPDSGEFQVVFARVGAGRGDYADSAVVSGRPVFRWVGAGNGSVRVGRALPLPESHRVVATGMALDVGALKFDFEGALSHRDFNTFSGLDDDDNTGAAGRAGVRLGGRVGGWLPGEAWVALDLRSVSPRFQPFERLERPFMQEAWGLPLGADLDHQKRADLTATWRAGPAGELRLGAGALRLPSGFESVRQTLDWSLAGAVTARLSAERADGDDPSRRFPHGGRERLAGEVRIPMRWIEPSIRGETDERRFPADSVESGLRVRELGLDLASPRRFRWRALAGAGVRRDGLRVSGGFAEQSRATVTRAALESPGDGRVGVTLGWQHRELEPVASTVRTRTDLTTLRLRLDEQNGAPGGAIGLEVTSEGESRRTRTVTFVGPGQGSYDAFGNFVGTGDYQLTTTVSSDFERVGRAALSVRAGWSLAREDAFQGSRVEFSFEGDARRRGELRGGDLWIAPDVVLGDPALTRASALRRFESDLAPSSSFGALRFRLERRVSGDRSFENFGQTLDDRIGTLRWRGRASGGWSAELEGRLKRQEASQILSGQSPYRRLLRESGGSGQLVWTPGTRLRVAAVGDLAWSRPDQSELATRTLRFGPDLGWTFGARGRADLQARRALISGPPAVALLPTADPAGAPEWEITARADVRVRDVTTVGFSVISRRFEDRAARTTGRFEVRAFF